MFVDKASPLPLYYQLKELLRAEIERGVWRPGDLIPSERELCQTYGISRITVRQALSDLVGEGLLRRDQGRGTFVAAQKIRKTLSRLTGFTAEMHGRGRKPGSRVLRQELAPALPRVAESLEVEAGQPVVLLRRLRLADGEPVGIEAAHLRFPGCEALLQEDLSGSLYEVLERRHGILPTQADESLEAEPCGRREAELLGIEPRAPVLLIQRLTRDQSLRPFEYVESVYRGDSYVFQVRLLAEERQEASFA